MRTKITLLLYKINPDFSVKMSNIPNFVTQKKKKKKRKKEKHDGHIIKYLLTELGRAGPSALGHGARTSLRSVRTP